MARIVQNQEKDEDRINQICICKVQIDSETMMAFFLLLPLYPNQYLAVEYLANNAGVANHEYKFPYRFTSQNEFDGEYGC